MFSNNGFFDDKYIDMITDYHLQSIELVKFFDKLPRRMFIDYIIMKGKESLNEVVPSGSFPAYSIAIKLHLQGREPTEKQFLAIRNVYIFNKTGYNPRREGVKDEKRIEFH